MRRDARQERPAAQGRTSRAGVVDDTHYHPSRVKRVAVFEAKIEKITGQSTIDDDSLNLLRVRCYQANATIQPATFGSKMSGLPFNLTRAE